MDAGENPNQVILNHSKVFQPYTISKEYDIPRVRYIVYHIRCTISKEHDVRYLKSFILQQTSDKNPKYNSLKMDINVGTKQDNVRMRIKERRAELRRFMNGKNINTIEKKLDFEILQEEARKYRIRVQNQDILEQRINEDYDKRKAILSKMEDHVELLKLKVQRRLNIQEKVARDLKTMDIKEIGEELEYLRKVL